MTSHRLIRYCSLHQAVTAAAGLHARSSLVDHRQGRSARLQWQTNPPAHTICWDVTVEQGANGVLVHLSADLTRGPLAHLARWARLAVLQPLNHRELTDLAAATAAPARTQAEIVVDPAA